jgi:hypothetical protein
MTEHATTEAREKRFEALCVNGSARRVDEWVPGHSALLDNP